MNLFIFLPTTTRCCGCTRKLRIACLFIAVCCMLINIHCFRIIFWPVCKDQYQHIYILNLVKWSLFMVNTISVLSNFGFLLGVLFVSYPLSADLFMTVGFTLACLMLTFGIMVGVAMRPSKCHNPSDMMASFIYFTAWLYFIYITRSYRDVMAAK